MPKKHDDDDDDYDIDDDVDIDELDDIDEDENENEINSDVEKDDEEKNEIESVVETDVEADEELEQEKKKKNKNESKIEIKKNTKCLYNLVPHKVNDIESLKNLAMTHINKIKTKYVPDDQRITKPIMTKYEFVRILGDRTQQIALGAKPMIRNYKESKLSPKEIALLEIKHKMVPFYLERELPNGNIEKWNVNELEI